MATGWEPRWYYKKEQLVGYKIKGLGWGDNIINRASSKVEHCSDSDKPRNKGDLWAYFQHKIVDKDASRISGWNKWKRTEIIVWTGKWQEQISEHCEFSVEDWERRR